MELSLAVGTIAITWMRKEACIAAILNALEAVMGLVLVDVM
jgi:hypothetical protein